MFFGGESWLKTLKSSVDSVRSAKPFSSCSASSSSSTWRIGGKDVSPAARVAIGSGWESGEYLGRRMPLGTTNPS